MGNYTYHNVMSVASAGSLASELMANFSSYCLLKLGLPAQRAELFY